MRAETVGRPFRKGYDPRRGDPVKAGKAGGRPPKWWRDLFLTYEAEALLAVRLLGLISDNRG